jgi:hypothetical protein
MMKNIEGQNFQVVFSPEEKWTSLREKVSLREKGTKFP